MGSPTNPAVDKYGRAPVKVDYSPAGPSNQVGFAFDKVQPPSIVYIQRDDVLIVQAATSQTAEVVTFNVRILQPDGRVEESQFVLRPLNARVSVTLTLAVSEGYLISLAVNASVATTRGMTFARAFINRSIFGATAPAQTIFADYVTTLVSSGYPNGRVLAPVEGPGNVYTFAVANPAAGSDWTAAVPANARWRVRSVLGNLNCSAVVSNRMVGFSVVQNARIVFVGGANANLVANSVANVVGAGFTPYTPISAGLLYVPLPPDLIIGSISAFSASITSNTTGLLAGDQWSSISLLIEEWLDNV